MLVTIVSSVNIFLCLQHEFVVFQYFTMHFCLCVFLSFYSWNLISNATSFTVHKHSLEFPLSVAIMQNESFLSYCDALGFIWKLIRCEQCTPYFVLWHLFYKSWVMRGHWPSKCGLQSEQVCGKDGWLLHMFAMSSLCILCRHSAVHVPFIATQA